MSYLSAEAHADIIADPGRIATFYAQNWRGFARDLGLVDARNDMENALLAAAWAAIVAWDLKPYGPETDAIMLADLLAEPTMACDSYVRLAWYGAQIVPAAAGVQIAALGWNAGAIGNHAQMMASVGTDTLLLDPTIGLVVRFPRMSILNAYNQILQGVPVLPADMASFENYNFYPGAFTQTVKGALLGGLYRPSDALYYVAALDLFNAMPDETTWPTPQAQGIPG